MNITATFYSHTIFRINSIYDPWLSGAGTQPYGRDQLVALYGSYEVYFAKMTLMFYNSTYMEENMSAMPLVILILPWHESAQPTYTELNDLVNIPGCQTYSWDTINHRTMKVHAICNCKKFWKQNVKGSVDPAGFGADVGTNPGHHLFWHVYLRTPDGSAVTCQTIMNVKINYYTKFFKRVELDES